MVVKDSKDKANKASRIFGELEADRMLYHSMFQNIINYIYPKGSDFDQTQTPGHNRMKYIYESTALTSHRQLASAVLSFIMSPTDKWFDLSPGVPDLIDDQEVRLYLEGVVDFMYAVFSDPRGAFYAKVHELILEQTGLGTGVFFVEERMKPRSIRFECFDLAQCYLDYDAFGHIQTVIRKEKYSVHQALSAFPNMNEDLKKKLMDMAQKHENTKIEILHLVAPESVVGVAPKNKSHKYVSLYIWQDEKEIFEEGGYTEMPYMAPRWDTLPGEKYGRGPGWQALPDVRTLNELRRIVINAGQKQIAPPLQVPKDTFLGKIDTRPNAINTYRRGYGKEAPIQPINMGNNINVAFPMESELKQSITTAFHIDLFLDDKRVEMSATESLQREEARMRLLAPQLGRLHTDFIQPLLERVYAIGVRLGFIGDIPEQLKGIGFKPVYVSPMARAQKMLQSAQIGRSLQDLSQYAGVDPTILDVINKDAMAQMILDAHGTSAKIINTPDQVLAIRQQRAKQEQAQAQSQQLLDGSQTALNFSKAFNEGSPGAGV